ncbi:hypothetical protein OPT61_g8818 [Boeremia exigua]|uniref:Uncharacterized protein n=1 Tax=Boeremia exigua TaxID=749465 RepID=A0ACC2HWM9_9PLEO|nr:hypothetical protein OPT61_g8818 [Boeremia exigua]
MSARYDALQASEDPIHSADPTSRAISHNNTYSGDHDEDQALNTANGPQNSKQLFQNHSARASTLSSGKAQIRLEELNTMNQQYDHARKADQGPARMLRRVGKVPCTLLVLSLIGTTMFIAYITFLWFTASQNQTWRRIALSGWTVRSIAISAAVLRAAATTQAGIASSMLAAIVLESTTGVLLSDFAPISLMRASAAAPYALLTQVEFRANKLSLAPAICAALLSMTTVSLQFTSTILLADVDSGFISRDIAPYTYVLPEDRATYAHHWQVAPRPWPIFAEHASNRVVNHDQSYSDTGALIRALLPISDTQSRSLVHSYQGPAPVFDLRTVCTRPNITDFQLLYSDEDWMTYMHGKFSIPEDAQSNTSTPWHETPTPFICERPQGMSYFFLGQPRTPNWDLIICQSFEPPFVRFPSGFSEGTHISRNVFLLANYTGYTDNQEDLLPLDPFNFNDTRTGMGYYNNNEWLDLKQDADTTAQTNSTLRFSDTKLSFTVCSVSAERRVLNVSMSTKAPLKEQVHFWDADRRQFRYDDIRRQLLRSTGTSLEERGVLSLQLPRPSQTAQPPPNNPEKTWSFGDPHAVINFGDDSHFLGQNLTIKLLGEKSEQSNKDLRELGLEMLRTGGSAAEAMQSMAMGVVLADYQQYTITHVPNSTNNSIASLRSDFVLAQVPGGNGRPADSPAGATRSYVIVMLVIAMHEILVSGVVVLFIKGTKNTLLWQNWQTVAQTTTAVTEPYLRQAGVATDAEVRRQMRGDGAAGQTVAIVASNEFASEDMTVRPSKTSSNEPAYIERSQTCLDTAIFSLDSNLHAGSSTKRYDGQNLAYRNRNLRAHSSAKRPRQLRSLSHTKRSSSHVRRRDPRCQGQGSHDNKVQYSLPTTPRNLRQRQPRQFTPPARRKGATATLTPHPSPPHTSSRAISTSSADPTPLTPAPAPAPSNHRTQTTKTSKWCRYPETPPSIPDNAQTTPPD